MYDFQDPDYDYNEILVDKIVKETEKAYLIIIDGEEEWIPKSVIENDLVPGNEDTYVGIQQWFVDKKGW